MEEYMTYRQDSDLEFLKGCEQDDLDILVHMLTTGKNGATRIAEELTQTERYKEHYPCHAKYWDLIAAELQTFGGNTIATIVRGGKGVLYKEILTDVCNKLKVNYNKNSPVSLIEMNLLMKILEESLDKMDSEQLKELVESMDLRTTNYTKQTVMAALQAAIRLGGFSSYRIALIVANAVAKAVIGRGLPFAVNTALAKYMAVFVGPIGVALTALWTLYDIAGPAYRVTIPAIIQVAYMRAKMSNKDNTN